MRVAVLGGGLQGVEATYLSHKAGWEVILLDKNTNVPAIGLCDHFIQHDITDNHNLDKLLKNIDIIIPATENALALEHLVKWNQGKEIPLAFDADAYTISSSKKESDRLFIDLGLAVPKPWPHCQYPLIAKPNSGSGSKGVQLFRHQADLEKAFPKFPPLGWVVQEYIEGPSFSLEIIGYPGHYLTLQVTDLEMDEQYDCKRVLAPSQLDPFLVTEFEKLSEKIAESICLHGLMDVEVILHKGELKVLEIDARLPSQTPTAVYWSTGINILELLAQCYTGKQKWFEVMNSIRDILGGKNREAGSNTKDLQFKGVIYEHIRVESGKIDICGEHIMTEGGPLKLIPGFFGADEAITNYIPGKSRWEATVIFSGNCREEAWTKREHTLKEIVNHF